MNDIQYYDHTEQKLTHGQENKVKKLISMKLIEYHRESKSFLCNPIPGYNTRTYQIKKRVTGRFECNCQFMTTQRKKVLNGSLSEDETRYCSHISALLIMFKNKAFVKGD